MTDSRHITSPSIAVRGAVSAGARDHGRYGLLASAIAGRRLEVSRAVGGEPFTNGLQVFLPEGMDAEQARMAVIVQSALVSGGSLEPGAMRRLRGHPSAARRYLTLEVDRTVGGCGRYLPAGVAEILLSGWGGLGSTATEESLARALAREPLPEPSPLFGVLRPADVLAGRPTSAASDAAPNQIAAPKTLTAYSEADDEDEEDEEEMRFLRRFSLALPIRSPLSRILHSALRTSLKRDGGGTPGELPAAAQYTRRPMGQMAIGQASRRVGATIAALLAPPSPVGLSYPEWDSGHRRYRADWCRVGEFDPGEGKGTPLERGGDQLLQRKLARLGLDFERHKRQSDGDRLDMAAVVDFIVAEASGQPADDRVYEARRRTARDLSVLVLLDASGSTADRHEQTEVWDEQRRFAARLVAGLEDVGDRVAAYGFNSWGRQQVRFLRVKDFDGRFDSGAARRLMALEPAGFTRLGAAVRHGVHLVTTRAGTARRLLVLISDGFPYDDGYEGTYAEDDTRRALEEAREHGVGVVCLCIAADTDAAALFRLWGGQPHTSVIKADDLTDQVEPLFRTAIRQAQARTRDVTVDTPRHSMDRSRRMSDLGIGGMVA